MEQTSKKFHYGYLIVGVAFMQLFMAGGIFFGSSGLFIVPVTESLGISQAQFSLYLTFQQVAMGVAVILAPKLVEKIPFKRIDAMAIIPLSLAYPIMAFANNVALLYVGGALIGLSCAFLTFLAPGTLIPRWFKSRLNTMIAFAAAGVGVGGMVFNPVISAMINGPALLWFAESWRSTYFILGCVVFVVCFPLAAFVLKDSPEDKGLRPYGEEEGRRLDADSKTKRVVEGVNKSDAIKSMSFIFLYINIISWNLGDTFVTFFPAYAASTAAASKASFDLVGLIGSVESVGAMVGGFIIGYLFDKFSVKVGTIYSSVAGVVAVIIMLLSKNMAVAMMIGSFIFGSYYQIANVSMPAMVNTMYGEKDYDQIFPRASAIAPWIGAVAFPLWGLINDLTGSFEASFIAVMVICAITSVSAILAIRASKKLPRHQETVEL